MFKPFDLNSCFSAAVLLQQQDRLRAQYEILKREALPVAVWIAPGRVQCNAKGEAVEDFPGSDEPLAVTEAKLKALRVHRVSETKAFFVAWRQEELYFTDSPGKREVQQKIRVAEIGNTMAFFESEGFSAAVPENARIDMQIEANGEPGLFSLCLPDDSRIYTFRHYARFYKLTHPFAGYDGIHGKRSLARLEQGL